MRKSKPLKDKPVYFVVRPMVDPSTGEMVGCLVPDSWASQHLLRERKYRTNDLVRATLTLPRNNKFFRLVHQLGTLVRNNIQSFEGLKSHDAIKRLQRESGICCDIVAIDASPVVSAILAAAESILGEVPARMLRAVLPEIKQIDVLEPQSLAFDSMDESDFRVLWEGICRHIVDVYWPTLDVQQITQMAALLPQSEGA